MQINQFFFSYIFFIIKYRSSVLRALYAIHVFCWFSFALNEMDANIRFTRLNAFAQLFIFYWHLIRSHFFINVIYAKRIGTKLNAIQWSIPHPDINVFLYVLVHGLISSFHSTYKFDGRPATAAAWNGTGMRRRCCTILLLVCIITTPHLAYIYCMHKI